MGFAAIARPYPSTSLDSCFSEPSYLSAFLNPRLMPIHISALPYPSKSEHALTRSASLKRKVAASCTTMLLENREHIGELSLKISRPKKLSAGTVHKDKATPQDKNSTRSSEDSDKPPSPTIIYQEPVSLTDSSPEKPLPKRPSPWSRHQITNPFLTIKKRKSFIALTTAPQSSEDTSTGSDPYSSRSSEEESREVLDISASADDGKEKFNVEEKNYFHIEDGVKYHPFSYEEAPYMQGYDRILLDNDRSTEALLSRINRNGSPTFHDYGNKPPNFVLDLGCGAGGWVIEAATAWRHNGSQITGFDLVDTESLIDTEIDPAVAKNITWLRGNFIKYDLPFPAESFDLVRMANLSLAIPYESWHAVLEEVRRVLTPSGILELIDDQIYFGYGKLPTPSSPLTITPKRHSDYSLFGPDSDLLEDQPSITRVPEKQLPKPPPDQVSEWEQHVADSRSLESMFQLMLEKKFKIHSRPSDFMFASLDSIFGARCTRKARTFHLALAQNADDSDRTPMQSSDAAMFGAKKTWMPSIEWDRKERRHDTSPLIPSKIPDTISAKAAMRLGISTDLPPARPVAAQSPGLVLHPSTFIPMGPAELEMHACKHMHTLVGCKAALGEFVSTFKDENDKPLVDKKEFDDLLWDYQCFRRPRFNWPNRLGSRDSFPMCESPAKPTHKRSNSHDSATTSGTVRVRHNPSPPSPPSPDTIDYDKLAHIRTIRVWHVFKGGEDPTASS